MQNAVMQRFFNVPYNPLNISDVAMRLQMLLMRDPRQLSTLPNNDPRKFLFELDEKIAADRKKELDDRYSRWEQEYQNCGKQSGKGTRQQARRQPGTGRTGPGKRGSIQGGRGQGMGQSNTGLPGQDRSGFGQINPRPMAG